MFFFDSHGALWFVCDADTAGAVAFGPEGIAAPAHPALGGLECGEGETPWSCARRTGRLVRPDDGDGWDTLAFPGDA